ncbi:hypothetical protein [Kitasatospora sp. NPDC005751]|uniref:hypothetical protein n=1 Tax=Kitasatospora sp. NPDC005751 TaxID=3157064 RepID=UPI003409D2FA
MPDHVETNVRLPFCALAALATVRERWGTSRDETVRQLLTKHVEAQEQELDPGNRRTHISTVLRYPLAPRWRRDPRRDRPLRLRAPASLLERSRAVSLTLPGQYERAHRDYQSRTLTDAVMTAIARAEHFTDDFLDDLLPLLRHNAALGLWKLATAATNTKPERNLLREVEELRMALECSEETPEDDGSAQRVLSVAKALENDVAWHSSARHQVMANIARDMLTGPDARANEKLLHGQNTEDWYDLYQDTLHAAGYRREGLLRGATSYDWTGRGGTAVWRAYRRVELHDFEAWLVAEDTRANRLMTPPGWLIRTPASWHAHTPDQTATGQLPEPYATWAAHGKVLTFPHKSTQVVWPLLRRPGRPGWKPVPGIEPLTAAAAGLLPKEVSGFIEAALIDWNHEFEDEPTPRIALDIPADLAHTFGYITAEERRDAKALARATTQRDIDATLDDFKEGGLDGHRLQQLQEVRDRAPEFRRLAVRFGKQIEKRRPNGTHIGSQFRVTRATWRWPGHTVIDELLAGVPARQVERLAAQAHRQRGLLLEYSMQEAWKRAFDQYGRRM